MTSGRVSISFRVTVLVGAAVSLVYLLIMYREQYSCLYCLVIHTLNLGFTIIVQRFESQKSLALSPLITFCAVFALVSTLLKVAESEQLRATHEQAEKDRYGVTDKIVDTSTSPANISAKANSSELTDPPSEVKLDDAVKREKENGARDRGDVQATRKPYQFGSEQAKLRLVIYFDYQSIQCRQIERVVQDLHDGASRQFSDRRRSVEAEISPEVLQAFALREEKAQCAHIAVVSAPLNHRSAISIDC